MRKTKLRKRTIKKKRIHKRRTRRIRSLKRGGSITTSVAGSSDKIVVAGPMGVMSENAYRQSMEYHDLQGAE